MDLFGTKSADFSPCRNYRYALWRRWDRGGPLVMFIGLNPSTADETEDDPTIRRCIGFAKLWGAGGLCMTNLFAFRATNPRDMIDHLDPIGPENNFWLQEVAARSGMIIAAWGAHGKHKGRDRDVLNIIPTLYCLGTTKDGQPRHPLYIKADTKPIIL